MTTVFDDEAALEEVKKTALRAKMVDTHATAFTHGDFTPRNILVKEGRVVAIISWEQAGWRPETWEYIKALYRVNDAFWPTCVPKIMTVYLAERELDQEDKDT